MKIIICVLIPALLQCLLVFVLVVSNQGNGSWVGLGALLLGMILIPTTVTLNVLYLNLGKYKTRTESIVKCYLIAFIVPLLGPIFILFL